MRQADIERGRTWPETADQDGHGHSSCRSQGSRAPGLFNGFCWCSSQNPDLYPPRALTALEPWRRGLRLSTLSGCGEFASLTPKAFRDGRGSFHSGLSAASPPRYTTSDLGLRTGAFKNRPCGYPALTASQSSRQSLDYILSRLEFATTRRRPLASRRSRRFGPLSPCGPCSGLPLLPSPDLAHVVDDDPHYLRTTAARTSSIIPFMASNMRAVKLSGSRPVPGLQGWIKKSDITRPAHDVQKLQVFLSLGALVPWFHGMAEPTLPALSVLSAPHGGRRMLHGLM